MSMITRDAELYGMFGSHSRRGPEYITRDGTRINMHPHSPEEAGRSIKILLDEINIFRSELNNARTANTMMERPDYSRVVQEVPSTGLNKLLLLPT